MTLEEFKAAVLARHPHVTWVGEFREYAPGRFDGVFQTHVPGKGLNHHTYFGDAAGGIRHAFVGEGDGFWDAFARP